MTKLQALGITIGSGGSVAVATGGGTRGAGAHGGDLVLSHRSALLLKSDGAAVFADSTAPGARGALLEDFVSRVGDPVGLLAEDGSVHAAADLVARAAECLVTEIAAATGEHPAAAVLCHPARWPAHAVEAQRTALSRAVFSRRGRREPVLMPEPLAAARWLAETHGPQAGEALVVLDLGASGASATVVRTGSPSGLVATVRSEEPAGAEFDLLTMRYVLANALGDTEFDPFDPATERGLAILRENCRAAKEILSKNTATTVCVPLDGASARVRLVRDELEELIRGPLLTCLDLVRDALHRAGLDIGAVDRVLLTGGGAAIPLVTELVSGEFGLPVIVAPEPAHTAAAGAALAAADLLTRTVPGVLAQTDNTGGETTGTDTIEIGTTAGETDAAGIAGTDSTRTDSTRTDAGGTEPTVTTATHRRTSEPATPRLPRPSRHRGQGHRRRAGVLAAAVAAIAVLTTGTVAVGGLPGDTAPPAGHGGSGAAAAATGETSDAAIPADREAGGDPGVATNADPAAAQPDTSAPSGGTDRPAGQPATGRPPAGEPTNEQPAPGQETIDPAPETPAGAPPPADVPASRPDDQPTPAPSPSPSPAPAPAPAPAPSGGHTQPSSPSTGGLGNTLGNTLGGVVGGVGEGVGKVGEGVGKLGEGIGQGVGGALGGLGG